MLCALHTSPVTSGVLVPKHRSDCVLPSLKSLCWPPVAHQIKPRTAASLLTTEVRMVVGGSGSIVRPLGLVSGSTPYQVVTQDKLPIPPKPLFPLCKVGVLTVLSQRFGKNSVRCILHRDTQRFSQGGLSPQDDSFVFPLAREASRGRAPRARYPAFSPRSHSSLLCLGSVTRGSRFFHGAASSTMPVGQGVEPREGAQSWWI